MLNKKLNMFHVNRSANGKDIIFRTMPSEYDHPFYRILLEVGTTAHGVSYFEYRSNPVIGNITSTISIVRFVITYDTPVHCIAFDWTY